MTIRPTVFQFWDTDPPQEIRNLLATWDAVIPEFGHEVFNDKAAEAFIRAELGAAPAACFLSCAVPAMRADFFRYCILLARGGVYADADTTYCGGLKELYTRGEKGMLFLRKEKVANDFMIFREAGSPLLRWVLDEAMQNIERRTSNNVWKVTGPGIMTALYRSGEPAKGQLFDGMHIATVKEIGSSIQFQWHLDYKKSAAHWTTAQSEVSIFRE